MGVLSSFEEEGMPDPLNHIICDWVSHLGILTIPKNKEEVIEVFKKLGIA